MEMTDEIRWGDVWIARRTDAVVDFALDPQRLAEVAPLVDALQAAVTDCGNNSVTLRAVVQREHASPAAARKFIMAHAREIAALPTAARVLTCSYFSAVTDTVTISPAVLTSFPAQTIGATSRHIYTFAGSAVT